MNTAGSNRGHLTGETVAAEVAAAAGPLGTRRRRPGSGDDSIRPGRGHNARRLDAGAEVEAGEREERVGEGPSGWRGPLSGGHSSYFRCASACIPLRCAPASLLRHFRPGRNETRWDETGRAGAEVGPKAREQVAGEILSARAGAGSFKSSAQLDLNLLMISSAHTAHKASAGHCAGEAYLARRSTATVRPGEVPRGPDSAGSWPISNEQPAGSRPLAGRPVLFTARSLAQAPPRLLAGRTMRGPLERDLFANVHLKLSGHPRDRYLLAG